MVSVMRVTLATSVEVRLSEGTLSSVGEGGVWEIGTEMTAHLSIDLRNNIKCGIIKSGKAVPRKLGLSLVCLSIF